MLPELWWFWMLWRFAILISHLMNYFVCLDEMRCLRFAWAMVQSRVLGFLLHNVLFFTPFFLFACGNEFCWFYIICCTINCGLESCSFAVGRAPELFSTYALNLMWPVGYCYELERWWSWRARGKDLARCQGRQLQGIVSCSHACSVLMSWCFAKDLDVLKLSGDKLEEGWSPSQILGGWAGAIFESYIYRVHWFSAGRLQRLLWSCTWKKRVTQVSDFSLA
jgi:hypothetical protein